MSRKNQKGQSTLEYLIIIAVVIAAIIAFATGAFRTKYTESLNHVADQMNIVINRINY